MKFFSPAAQKSQSPWIKSMYFGPSPWKWSMKFSWGGAHILDACREQRLLLWPPPLDMLSRIWPPPFSKCQGLMSRIWGSREARRKFCQGLMSRVLTPPISKCQGLMSRIWPYFIEFLRKKRLRAKRAENFSDFAVNFGKITRITRTKSQGLFGDLS